MSTGTIFDIKKFSIHDGPGIRTTVFFKGCPLNCWWCHNPESQALATEIMFRDSRCIGCRACLETCVQGAISWNENAPTNNWERCTTCGDCADVCFAQAREMVGREMTVAEVMTEIEKDVTFYDESGGGVTFSGGEPLLQADFLLALLRACQEKEIHTALDSSGFASWATLNQIREYVDLFLYDLKLMDETQHRKFTGVPNRPILENLERLAAHRHNIILRMPIIPGVNDDDENIRRTGARAAALPGLNQLDILPYHPTAAHKYDHLNKTYGLSETRSPSEEKMTEIAQTLQGFGLQVKIGG